MRIKKAMKKGLRFARAITTTHPRFVAMESAYPNAVKTDMRPGYDISTPELGNMVLRDDAVRRLGQGYRVPDDYVAVIEQALVCLKHNVVMSRTGDLVSESSNAGSPKFFPRRRIEQRQKVRISGSATLLRARFCNYYHVLIDGLPRLVSIVRSPSVDANATKLMSSSDATDMEAFCLAKLGLSSNSVEQLDDEPLYEVERLVFTPFKTRLQAGYLPKEYVSHLRNSLLPSRPRKRTRLFVSRQGARERAISNHREVLGLLSIFGFVETTLETMSAQEQVDTLYDAEAIVGVHGAGLTNMLFSPEGLKVFEIFPTYYVIPHYYYLSRSLGHEYTYQCEGGDTRSVRSFKVDVRRLEASLLRSGISRNGA